MMLICLRNSMIWQPEDDYLLTILYSKFNCTFNYSAYHYLRGLGSLSSLHTFFFFFLLRLVNAKTSSFGVSLGGLDYYSVKLLFIFIPEYNFG